MAKRQAAANPDRTVFSIKGRMGSDYRVRIGEREFNPPPVEMLRQFIPSLLGSGISESAIEVMVKHNPAKVLALD